MRNHYCADLQNGLTKPAGAVASRLLGRAGAAIAIAGLSVLGASALSFADESIGGASTVVNLVTGDLASGDNVSVVKGDDVFRDEGVSTDADSSARLILRDNTNMLLGPSSSIKLDRFVYAGPSEPGAIAVNLVKGALRFATGDADKKAYVISTPTATLGVRGTILKILSYGPSKTLVVLDEGGALVCTRQTTKKHCLDLTEPGQGVEVTVTGIKWASDANSTVSAVIAAIPEPNSTTGQNGGEPPVVIAIVQKPPPPPPPPDDGCGGGGDDGDAIGAGPHIGHHKFGKGFGLGSPNFSGAIGSGFGPGHNGRGH
jgi:hypothetical protein